MQGTKTMINILKGFIIGIGKIIPGVSGAILAILMGVYDKSVYYINNFKDNKKEGIKYLLPLGIGIITSIIFFSKIINYLLDKYYIMTMLFFVGLIIGTIPSITKKINRKDYYLIILSLIIFLSASLLGVKNNYIIKGSIIDILVFTISGLFEAIGTVVPGVSSTALLMTIGTYKIIISTISDITNISNIISNLKIIIPFGIGTILGIISVVKVIDYLFKKHNNKMYSVILGLLLSTIIIMIIDTFKYKDSIIKIFMGTILMVIGILISSIFEK